jgi:hypothetical protein
MRIGGLEEEGDWKREQQEGEGLGFASMEVQCDFAT